MSLATGAAPKRGWYFGWNMVAGRVLAQVAGNGLAINSLSLFLNSWAHDLHTQISVLLYAMLPLAVMTAVASPVVGALADKHPRAGCSQRVSPGWPCSALGSAWRSR